MTPLLWTIIPFIALVAITSILCVVWKKLDTPDGPLRLATLLGVLLSHLYVPLALIVWSYIGLESYIGWGWSVAVCSIFWFVPWLAGLQPVKPLVIFPLESAMNFVSVRLEGWGFQTFKGIGGNTIFTVNGEKERAAMADMMKQIFPQIRDQIKNPLKRWFVLHWRWYDPLVGGYCCWDKEMAHTVDDLIHNTYGYPITRRVSINAPTPVAGFNIVEVNM